MGCANADGHGFGERLAQVLFAPPCRRLAGLGVHQNVEMGLPKRLGICRGGAHGSNDIDGDAHVFQQAGDLGDVIPVAEAERRRAKQVAAGSRAGFALRTRRVGRWCLRSGQRADNMIEGLGRTPVFLALVGRQL